MAPFEIMDFERMGVFSDLRARFSASGKRTSTRARIVNEHGTLNFTA